MRISRLLQLIIFIGLTLFLEVGQFSVGACTLVSLGTFPVDDLGVVQESPTAPIVIRADELIPQRSSGGCGSDKSACGPTAMIEVEVESPPFHWARFSTDRVVYVMPTPSTEGRWILQIMAHEIASSEFDLSILDEAGRRSLDSHVIANPVIQESIE